MNEFPKFLLQVLFIIYLEFLCFDERVNSSI